MTPEYAETSMGGTDVQAERTSAVWHFGKKFIPGGKKKPFWCNHWLTHPCKDLAFPFEVGARAGIGQGGVER